MDNRIIEAQYNLTKLKFEASNEDDEFVSAVNKDVTIQIIPKTERAREIIKPFGDKIDEAKPIEDRNDNVMVKANNLYNAFKVLLAINKNLDRFKIEYKDLIFFESYDAKVITAPCIDYNDNRDKKPLGKALGTITKSFNRVQLNDGRYALEFEQIILIVFKEKDKFVSLCGDVDVPVEDGFNLEVIKEVVSTNRDVVLSTKYAKILFNIINRIGGCFKMTVYRDVILNLENEDVEIYIPGLYIED